MYVFTVSVSAFADSMNHTTLAVQAEDFAGAEARVRGHFGADIHIWSITRTLEDLTEMATGVRTLDRVPAPATARYSDVTAADILNGHHTFAAVTMERCPNVALRALKAVALALYGEARVMNDPNRQDQLRGMRALAIDAMDGKEEVAEVLFDVAVEWATPA